LFGSNELLCNTLVCEPNDLLAWQPDKTKNYLPDHPLNKLKAELADDDWQQKLAVCPLKN
jgi:hypothetical protein